MFLCCFNQAHGGNPEDRVKYSKYENRIAPNLCIQGNLQAKM